MYNHSIMQASDGSPRVKIGPYFELLIHVARALFVVVLSLRGVSVTYVLYDFHASLRFALPCGTCPGLKKRTNSKAASSMCASHIRHGYKRSGSDAWACPQVLFSSCRPSLFPSLLLLFSPSNVYFSLDRTTFIWPFYPKLLALDPVVVSYILQNNVIFQNSELLRFILGHVSGRGMYHRPIL
jgi:hypothetical protein